MVHTLSIGARWKQARERAGLSGTAAAKAAGVHENTVYLLENDRKNEGVTVRLAKQVADAYGVSLGEIFGCDDPRPENVPLEIRPLMEALVPLDSSARESIVRNIASNLRFMSSLYSTQNVSGLSKTVGSTMSAPITTQPESNSHEDVPRHFAERSPQGPDETAARAKRRRHPDKAARKAK